MEELVDLGLSGSSLNCEDGAVFEGENFLRLVDLVATLEEPLETLDRRGIDLKFLSTTHANDEGLLPCYRVFLGREQHWFAEKEQLDKFLADEEARRGEEFRVADEAVESPNGKGGGNGETAGGAPETILKVVGLARSARDQPDVATAKGLRHRAQRPIFSSGNKNGEPFHPFVIKHSDGEVRLDSLRDLLPSLRKIGEKGLRLTRFKGLGEMDSEELWDTSMDPEKRTLLPGDHGRRRVCRRDLPRVDG